MQNRPKNVSWQLWIVLFSLYSTFIITFFHNKKEETFRIIYAAGNLKEPNNKFEFNFYDQLDTIKADSNINVWIATLKEPERISNYIVAAFFPKQQHELMLHTRILSKEHLPDSTDILLF